MHSISRSTNPQPANSLPPSVAAGRSHSPARLSKICFERADICIYSAGGTKLLLQIANRASTIHEAFWPSNASCRHNAWTLVSRSRPDLQSIGCAICMFSVENEAAPKSHAVHMQLNQLLKWLEKLSALLNLYDKFCCITRE